ncbi:MAG: hypothetical protein A3I61_18050 [Acidobacteria bacterium RIFCSPLOWO2_02_FULL_68_18]|nr:MAG: hypothetical protein A3I61_18050 [Acidobacteria bacterium RIFCSPLOWO2_02_FULL_68_18]OFW49592.1 MAG: hypothetical protein A3G77_16100 [Acidobacteria bacterium RIFCSPLOWO2_12_FULL_68_19]
MATLVPFRALRPTPDAAPRVAAVPYDVVNTEEARSLAAGNALSFLHVSRAEIDLPPAIDPYSDAVYRKAAENFCALKQAAPLVLEEAPSTYVYRLRMGDHVQTGVAACYSVAEYESGVIKKHEHTRRDKEDDRTRHIIELRAQTGPVFLVHRASAAIDEVVARTTGHAPLFDVVAPDGVQHLIWRVDPRDQDHLVRAFAAVPALYIADGHHRAASAARARRQLGGAAGAAGEWDRFLAVAFPDDQMQVLPYNRVVRDLGGYSPESLLDALGARVTVKAGPARPARKGEVAMLLDGGWHTIELGPPQPGLSPADRLDVSRLQDLVLTPLLGIGDVRTDKRIDFVGGARGVAELERLVASGRAAVAFSMYPVKVDDLMAVCDAGGIMPPKSTWFEPKLRDGLLSHVI